MNHEAAAKEIVEFHPSPWLNEDQNAHMKFEAERRVVAILRKHFPPDAEAERQWQPIETAPKDSSWVLALMRTRRQTVIRWGGGAWEDDNRLCRDPTHWMPLPPRPKEVAHD